MQEVNPVPTPVVTPQVVVEQPKQNNFITILLSVLLLIAVSIAGFFAYQTQKLVKELTVLKNEPTPTAIAKVEPTSDPGLEPEPVPLDILTKDWKTYTNEKFVFKYPTDITINLKTQGQEEIFNIKGLEKDISLVVDPIVDHNFYLGKQVSKVIKSNNVSWNLLTGNQQYCDGGECGNISDAIQVEHQGKRYTIVLGDLVYPDTILDQILSTFKFIN